MKNVVERYLRSWKQCRRCGLSEFRRLVVLGRGGAPAPVLLIGEAPGKSENVVGEAFVGVAGRVLNKLTAKAAKMAGVGKPECYVTNVLGCRPCDSKQADNREPTPEEAAACRPRLVRTIQLVDPREIVLMGRVAEREAGRVVKKFTYIQHPAFIARQSGESEGSAGFRAVARELAAVFERVAEKGEA